MPDQEQNTELKEKLDKVIQALSDLNAMFVVTKDRVEKLQDINKEQDKAFEDFKNATQKRAEETAKQLGNVDATLNHNQQLLWTIIPSVGGLVILVSLILGFVNFFIGPSATQQLAINQQRDDIERFKNNLKEMEKSLAEAQKNITETATVAKFTRADMDKSADRLRESTDAAKALGQSIGGLRELLQKEFDNDEKAEWGFMLLAPKATFDKKARLNKYLIVAENFVRRTRAFLICGHVENKDDEVAEYIRLVQRRFKNSRLIKSLEPEVKDRKIPDFVSDQSFVLRHAPNSILKSLGTELKKIDGMIVNESYVEARPSDGGFFGSSKLTPARVISLLAESEELYTQPWEYIEPGFGFKAVENPGDLLVPKKMPDKIDPPKKLPKNE